MKNLAISLLIVATVLLAGCIGYSEPIPAPTPSESPNPNVVLPGEPPADRTWISPGKVQVGNFYPGARAEWDITIHNGGAEACTFVIRYRYPDHVEAGYDYPPVEAQDWVIVADPTPILAPKETRDILVALDMPKEVTSCPEKWEFWISVVDLSQTGMVRTELACRWLVQMR